MNFHPTFRFYFKHIRNTELGTVNMLYITHYCNTVYYTTQYFPIYEVGNFLSTGTGE